MSPDLVSCGDEFGSGLGSRETMVWSIWMPNVSGAVLMLALSPSVKMLGARLGQPHQVADEGTILFPFPPRLGRLPIRGRARGTRDMTRRCLDTPLLIGADVDSRAPQVAAVP